MSIPYHLQISRYFLNAYTRSWDVFVGAVTCSYAYDIICKFFIKLEKVTYFQCKNKFQYLNVMEYSDLFICLF